jgi:hypothetical protein
MKLTEALAGPTALADALKATKPACVESFATADPPAAADAAKAPTTKETTMFFYLPKAIAFTHYI